MPCSFWRTFIEAFSEIPAGTEIVELGMAREQTTKVRQSVRLVVMHLVPTNQRSHYLSEVSIMAKGWRVLSTTAGWKRPRT